VTRPLFFLCSLVRNRTPAAISSGLLLQIVFGLVPVLLVVEDDMNGLPVGRNAHVRNADNLPIPFVRRLNRVRIDFFQGAYAQNGMHREAVAERQKVLTLSGSPDLAAAIGEDYNKSGYSGVLQSWLEGLNEVSKRNYVSSYSIAQIHARLGNKPQSLAMLERAYSARDGNLTYLKIDQVFDDLRPDPQFQGLLRKLAIPE
jgi:hypothetical protein